ncbi:Arm DNA-binding domain-containing protein [Alcaligenaceae bacterium LG-2]|uniref:Arm DNA-binding domain-containing protein n=1 Tax=Yanghanlia caeni TaxID=3064283 RepID=A0ABU1D8A2_9BURK|nr:Arm DNA-binding domain-containing protein [Alcaligenaceae bacterium LG-2]
MSALFENMWEILMFPEWSKGIRAKPGPRLQKLSDGRGLQLHITSAGSKLWRWAYRFDGKQKLMAFGVYPAVSLAQARQAADEARSVLAAGIDPMEQRKADKVSLERSVENTFETVAREWAWSSSVPRVLATRSMPASCPSSPCCLAQSAYVHTSL